MTITIVRKYKKEGYTIGTLSIDGETICNTLEPQDRGLTSAMPLDELKKLKVKGKTAIPTGRYAVVMRMSGKFRARRAFLENVPGYVGVMIHEGNTKKDTEGCILVGWNTMRGQVTSSRKALGIVNERILKCLDTGECVGLEIKGFR